MAGDMQLRVAILYTLKTLYMIWIQHLRIILVRDKSYDHKNTNQNL